LLREAGFDPDEAFLEMAKDKERLEELGLSFQPAGAAKPPSDETEADEEADASSEEEEKIEE